MPPISAGFRLGTVLATAAAIVAHAAPELQVRVVQAPKFSASGALIEDMSFDPVTVSGSGPLEVELYVLARIIDVPGALGVSSFSGTLRDSEANEFAPAPLANAETVGLSTPGLDGRTGMFPSWRATIGGGSSDPGNGAACSAIDCPPTGAWTYLPLSINAASLIATCDGSWCPIYKVRWITEDLTPRTVCISAADAGETAAVFDSAGDLQFIPLIPDTYKITVVEIPPPRGACCIGDACMRTTESDCNASGGRYLGDLIDCPVTLCGAARLIPLPDDIRRWVFGGPVLCPLCPVIGEGLFDAGNDGRFGWVAIDFDTLAQPVSSGGGLAFYNNIQRVAIGIDDRTYAEFDAQTLDLIDSGIFIGNDPQSQGDAFEFQTKALSEFLEVRLQMAGQTDAMPHDGDTIPQTLLLERFGQPLLKIDGPGGELQIMVERFGTDMPALPPVNECVAETTGDSPPDVGVEDLLNFLSQWFPANAGAPCP